MKGIWGILFQIIEMANVSIHLKASKLQIVLAFQISSISKLQNDVQSHAELRTKYRCNYPIEIENVF